MADCTRFFTASDLGVKKLSTEKLPEIVILSCLLLICLARYILCLVKYKEPDFVHLVRQD